MKIFAKALVGGILSLASIKALAVTQVACTQINGGAATWLFDIEAEPSARLASNVLTSNATSPIIPATRVAQYAANQALLYMLTDDSAGNINYVFSALPAFKNKSGAYSATLTTYTNNLPSSTVVLTCTSTSL